MIKKLYRKLAALLPVNYVSNPLFEASEESEEIGVGGRKKKSDAMKKKSGAMMRNCVYQFTTDRSKQPQQLEID